MSETSGTTLGETLRSLREMKDKSLKAVAEPADMSTAYLLKLEKDQVTTPSPHVLHRLAEQLDTPYMVLMRLAGYVVPDTSAAPVGAMALALSSQDMTEDEARAVAAFLKMYRNTSKSE